MSENAYALVGHLIGGKWTGSEQIRESLNPSTGAVVGTFYDAGEAEARAAVHAAAYAFASTDWGRDHHDRTITWKPVPATDGRLNCSGYWGTFKAGTWVMEVDWDSITSVECFGIAPDRTIWHAWTNSGGWKVMPGGGRADDTYSAAEPGGGVRQVSVWVNNYGVYCQNYKPYSWEGSWFSCG